MEGNGSVAARCMECEQNVVSVRQRQIWEVTGKYGKGQEFKYFIAPGKVSKNMLPRNCCIKGLFVNAYEKNIFLVASMNNKEITE